MKKRANTAVPETGKSDVGKYAGRHFSPTHDEIAQLAFTFYESRGRRDGHHAEDWLRAEQELAGSDA